MLLLLSFALSFLNSVYSQNDVGKIFIGSKDPSTDLPVTERFIFNTYSSSQSLPVYALVYVAGNPASLTALSSDVTVSCSVVSNSFGSSIFTLATTVIQQSNSFANGTISVTGATSGRDVEVTCSGTSVSSATPCVLDVNTQFCPDSSLSNVVSVGITPPGFLVFPDDVVQIFASSSSQSFQLAFSETTISAVTVSCSTAPVITTFTIPVTTASAGSSSTRIDFTASNFVSTTEVTVACSADSVGNQQFAAASSEREAIFVVNPVSVSFTSRIETVFNISAALYFRTNRPVTTRSINVKCQAKTYGTLVEADDIENEALNAQRCSFTSGSFDSSSPWRVQTPSFKMPATGETQAIYSRVQVERVDQPGFELTEVVAVVCCVDDSSTTTTDPDFNQLSAVGFIVAHISPYVCAGCNETIANGQGERTIENPGYVELAECPCDLTQAECDLECCCDLVCSDEQKLKFSQCTPGLKGGQTAATPDYKCGSDGFGLPDWHRLTCVYWESNGYLGLYYQNYDKITRQQTLVSRAAASSLGKFSFAEENPRFNNPDLSVSSYKGGMVVTTVRQDDGSTGDLSLPQPGATGACNPLHPVRYLQDVSATCPQTPTSESCQRLSVFDARVYVASTNQQGSQSFKVTSLLRSPEVVETDVRYYCPADVSPWQSVNLAPLSPNTRSMFSNLLDLNCSSGCSDQRCWQYNTGRSVENEIDLTGLPRCSFDNSYDPPPTPVSSSCLNAVLEVRYKFIWQGSEIKKLEADIVLAGASIVGNPVNQRFTVKWQHETNLTSTITLSDNYENLSTPYTRSGSGGYQVSKALVSGCGLNETTGQFDEVDDRPEKRLAVWKPDMNGLCVDAKREPVTFGEDVFSSCALHLTFSDLSENCLDTRQLITNHLNVLMSAELIGRFGFNNKNNESHWIPVLRASPYDPDTVTVTESPPITTLSPDVSNYSDPWQSLAQNITGICYLPVGVKLTVLYAQAGAALSAPRYEVVGGYINYTYSNWTMDCSPPKTDRCDPLSGQTQAFYLTSSVSFLKIPATEPSKKSRFYTRFDPYTCDSDSCFRFFTDFATDVCYYDTCWRELFYPLTPSYTGEKPFYSLSFFLVLVLGIVGYVSVGKPGWSLS